MAHLHRGDNEAMLARFDDQSGAAMTYLCDVARMRLGRLSNERGESFAHGFSRLHQDDIVTIATIQKSGTHWMRFLLTNYARALSDSDLTDPINYPTLIRRYYGNNRWQVFREEEPYREPPALLTAYGISDIAMQHFRSDFDALAFTPGKKILLYRNPLDYVVSLYHYTIAQRPALRHRAGHPRHVMQPMLAEYARHYTTLRSYQGLPSAFTASYEDMRSDPAGNLQRIVNFLGLSADDHAMQRAVALSDISVIRSTEEQRGRSMVVSLDGYFTRDGSIGQWKRFFSTRDVQRARRLLGRHGIDLSLFTIEN